MATRHFYVSSVVGTNTGTTDTSYGSQQTGTFAGLTASNVYDSLGRVSKITVPPTDEDIIYVANNHSAAYDNVTPPDFNSAGTPGGLGLQIVSVDNTDIVKYLPGASDELNDSGDDMIFSNSGVVSGVDLKTSDNVISVSNHDAMWRYQDMTVNVSSGGLDTGVFGSNDAHIHLVNVTINTTAASNTPLHIINNCVTEWIEGALTGTVTTGNLLNGVLDGRLYMTGVDLSNHSGTLMQAAVGSSDHGLMRLQNCKLHALVTLHGDLATQRQRFEMFNTDDGTADVYHRFYVADGIGSARNNDAVYVTDVNTWYGGTDQSSIEVRTHATRCSHIAPFHFTLPAQYVDLSATASDVLTVDMTTNLALTDTDIAAFLVYPDGTTKVTPITIFSTAAATTPPTGSNAPNPIEAGNTLDTSALGAGDWTGESTTNFYKLELDTSGTAGEEGVLAVRIEVYKSGIDGTTNQLFINPVFSLS